MSKIKNIIIFTVIVVLLTLAYIFFIKKSPEEQNLVSFSPTNTVLPDIGAGQDLLIAKDFLSVLLSVKSIKLDDTIFSDKAFINLRDSSILLVSPGNEGRLNPFAPIGYEAVTAPIIPIVPPATSIEIPPTTPTKKP